jgi:purine nucleosidase
MTDSANVRRPVVLDTDIGTDVDDVFALGTLLGSPEVRLVGCTTVYGDVRLRARLAARMLRSAGRSDVPVVCGERETLAGLPIMWGGWEGVAQPGLDAEPIDESPRAVEFLAERARAYPGELDVIAIGPLTNVATAIRRYPDFAGHLHRLVVMGGWFGEERRVEHNFACDPVAVQIVLEAGIPMTVTGLEITGQASFGYDELGRIVDTGTELARFVEAEARNYWTTRDVPASSPHDPLALLPIVRPELFEFREVSIGVADDGTTTARPYAEPAAEPRVGSMRLAVAARVTEVVEEIVLRIRSAANACKRPRPARRGGGR